MYCLSPTSVLYYTILYHTIYRTFVTKMWNIGKYIDHIFSSLATDRQEQCFEYLNKPYSLSRHQSLSDHYIIYKLHSLVVQTTSNMNGYQQIAEGGKQIADFIWSDFADWYVEISKLQLMRGATDATAMKRAEEQHIATYVTLLYVYKTLLQLIHPYMPYITETLWQCKPKPTPQSNPEIDQGIDQGSIMISQWPGSCIGKSGSIIPRELEELNIYRELETGELGSSGSNGSSGIGATASTAATGTGTEKYAYKSHQCVEVDYQCFQSIVRGIRAIRAGMLCVVYSMYMYTRVPNYYYSSLYIIHTPYIYLYLHTYIQNTKWILPRN